MGSYCRKPYYRRALHHLVIWKNFVKMMAWYDMMLAGRTEKHGLRALYSTCYKTWLPLVTRSSLLTSYQLIDRLCQLRLMKGLQCLHLQKLTFMVSEGKYAIHASYGYCKPYFCHEDWAMMDQFDGISSWCPSLKDGKTKDIVDQLTAIRWILARFLFGGWLWERGTARNPISKGRHIPINEKRAVLS